MMIYRGWMYTDTVTREKLTAQFGQRLDTTETPEMCDPI